LANHEGKDDMERDGPAGAAQMDAGAIWASYNFELSGSSIAKSSVYRRQVTKAAVHGVLEGRLQLSC
jgi:hypothetical protein